MIVHSSLVKKFPINFNCFSHDYSYKVSFENYKKNDCMILIRTRALEKPLRMFINFNKNRKVFTVLLRFYLEKFNIERQLTREAVKRVEKNENNRNYASSNQIRRFSPMSHVQLSRLSTSFIRTQINSRTVIPKICNFR